MANIFGESERKIRALFSKGEQFTFQGKPYAVSFSSKPTCRDGEPKTDVYIAAKSILNDEICEIKISFKQRNADFLENKTNAERARQLFGNNWQGIVTAATLSIAEKFKERPIVYKSKRGKTEKGAITLGWKFELMNKSSGELSGKLSLTNEQTIDVYAGTNLAADKRDAAVEGRIIKDSGIATHILFDDADVRTAQDAINNLQSVRDYVALHPNIYFACKALNYRTFLQKYDGNRPLSVYIDWNAVDGKLCGTPVFDEPLLHGGDEIAERLIRAMRQLGVATTDEITADMLDNSVNYVS